MFPLSITRWMQIRTLAVGAGLCLLPTFALAHGSFDERIEAANRAVAAAPSDPEARLVRADLLRRHGDFGAALEDLEEVDRLSPNLPRTLYFRGLVHLSGSRPGEAEVLIRRFLERQPIHAAGYEAHARALLALERPLEAAGAYDLAIAQQSIPVPDHYVERARAYAAAGNEHIEEAIRGLDAGLVVMGSVVSLERVSIELELRRGATDAALARLDRITKRSPRRESWLAKRGEILVRAGRNDEARESFALALSELKLLSSRKRRTPAMARLESELQQNLVGLEPVPSRGTP